MKLTRLIILSLGILTVSTLCLSCTKTTPKVAGTDADLTNTTLIQIFNSTVRSTRNYVYVDGAAVSGSAFAFGGVFPATAYAFKVAPGLRSFLIRDTLNSSTQVPLVFSENLELGKSYTIFTYDSLTNPKQATILNDIEVPSDTTARLRFANFIYNTSALPNVDVYSFRKGPSAPVFANISTTQVTNFIPYASSITDTLYVYATGTTSPLIVKAIIPALVPQRSYTTTYNGSYRGTRALSTFATY